MLALADDPRVTAAIVITDGDITYPAEPMPYARAVDSAAARPARAFRRPTGAWSRCSRRESADEGRAGTRQLFRPAGQAVAASSSASCSSRDFSPPTRRRPCTISATPSARSYYFRVIGQIDGQLWGTDIYTGNSMIGAAAVHAGLMKPLRGRRHQGDGGDPAARSSRARCATASPATISGATARPTAWRRSDMLEDNRAGSPCETAQKIRF